MSNYKKKENEKTKDKYTILPAAYALFAHSIFLLRKSADLDTYVLFNSVTTNLTKKQKFLFHQIQAMQPWKFLFMVSEDTLLLLEAWMKIL